MTLGTPFPKSIHVAGDTSPALISALADLSTVVSRLDRKGVTPDYSDGTGAEEQLLVAMPYHAVFAGRRTSLAAAPAANLAWMATEVVDIAEELGTLTWRDILLRQLFTALAEDDNLALREHLLSSAADLVRWAAAIGQRLDDDINADRAGRGTDR